MTWIGTQSPEQDPQLAEALQFGMAGYPKEYAPEIVAGCRLPEPVKNDSIVLAHSLIPEALKHVFAAYRSLLDPALPLKRRQHELIAATVSAVNRCFY
jgi:hypothetical protein